MSEDKNIPDIQDKDPDLSRWVGYKKLYDILAGHAKERWQCGYNVIQMFLKEYAGISVPLYTLQYFLRQKARKFKEQSGGNIANLTPEENLKFGEFLQLEDMAAYIFGIKPFSDEFNDAMYYPALLSTNVGGNQVMTVKQLFANKDGRYLDTSQACNDARKMHLACVVEKTKYRLYKVDGKEYTGGQLFAKEYDGKGYILKGEKFDSIRSDIAVIHCADDEVKIGGIVTSVSNLFGYEYDREVYEQDREYYARVFYEKLRHYFNYIGTKAGVPVVFNAMIYLIVDVTMNPEPAVYMLDPHDMQFQGEKFRDKKKMVPLKYILGSPTGATLFFPPNDPEIKKRLREEFSDEDLLAKSRERFAHLLELALYNKEAYLSQFIKRSVGDPIAGLETYVRELKNFGENVFDNAILEELCVVFEQPRTDLTPLMDFITNLSYSGDLLADELAHHFQEFTKEHHALSLKELFKIKNVFISLPSYIKTVDRYALPYKDEKLWKTCITVGNFINMSRIQSGTGTATRSPLTDEELNYYTFIYRGLFYLFNSQDRYSHVEIVNEFLGNQDDLNKYYIMAAVGEGLTKGNNFRNSVWVGIVEKYLKNLADELHSLMHGSVLLDMSIDRFLSKMENGTLKINEELWTDIAEAYNKACNELYIPLDAILWMVEKLKNRMKDTNIIKRQVLVAISANINSHPDLKNHLEEKLEIRVPENTFTFNQTRDILMNCATKAAEIAREGGYTDDAIYMLANGDLFRDPERKHDWPKVIEAMDEMRKIFAKDMNGLQEIIQDNIGTIENVDAIKKIIQFNDLFKLEGSKETEFASKINSIYNEKYEVLNFDDVEENISPLTIRENES
ncbi:hypothetical protein GF325_02690 [Candidatus Bathyarchaeota archaeon]|nr:hypothetical protein [Candidatus Bathyarchaeota archaeon]